MIGRLNHIALVVDDLEIAERTWKETLGATVSARQALPEHGVTVVFIDLPNTRCLLYTSPSPRDQRGSRMPSSA